MQGVRWRATLAVLAVLVSARCGRGGSPASPSPAPTPTPPGGAAPVVLDGSNFDALVLASTRPCLVEFQLPT